MLGVTFLAKLAKSAFEILLELSGLLEISRLTHRFLGLSRLELSIVASVAFVVLGIVTYKMDWEPIAVRASRLFGRRSGPASARVRTGDWLNTRERSSALGAPASLL